VRPALRPVCLCLGLLAFAREVAAAQGPRGTPPPHRQSPPGPRLSAPGLRIALSPTDGHLESLYAWGERPLAGVATDSVGLWTLDLAPGKPVSQGVGMGEVSRTATGDRITAAQAGRFRWRRTGDALELQWEQFGARAPTLRVTVTVRMRRDTTSAWRIRLDGTRGLPVEAVHFPRVTGISKLGPVEELAVPLWMGQRARDPRQRLAGADGKGRRLEWVYPGALSLQAIAFTAPPSGGLYFAADDTLAFRKTFALWGDSDGSAGYDMVHLPSDPGASDVYAPSYSAIVGAVRGDWFSAAERYRAWGTRQYWARTSRLATGVTPAWIRETGIWVWNRGRSDAVLGPASQLQKDAGLPVSVFWHWWHHGPYDTSFPDYLPPREGEASFAAAVKNAHDAGLHAIVYMNQRLWCVNTPSWKRENAERWAVRERDGSLRTEVYNVFDPLPCATMDISTPFWRDKYAGIADTVMHQYGLDGIYMDQAVLSLVCWSADHGHPVGGGHYWMDGFRLLASDLRRRGATRPFGFAGEGGGESWMPDLDAFLTLQVSQERYADPASGWEVIPFFQAAYHPFAVTYGTYGSLTWPPYDDLWPVESRPANALTLLDRKYRRQYFMEQARMFVWGMQPTIANFLPEQLAERRAEVDYLERLARLRYGLREFFLNGTMLRPPDVRVPAMDVLLSRVSIYASRRGGASEASTRAPAVFSSAWRAADGRVAIALASISEDSTTVELQLDLARYHLRSGARLVRHDATGSHPMGTIGAGTVVLRVALGALEGAVMEVEKE
jgi:head-tail adaptor